MRAGRLWWRHYIGIIVAAFAIAGVAQGHPPVSTVASLEWTREGRVTVRVDHDALAFALNETSARIADGPMYELLNGPRDVLATTLADACERMAFGVRITADGALVPLEIVDGLGVEAFDTWKHENPAGLLPVRMEAVLTGTLLAETKSLTLRLPPILGDAILAIRAPGVEPIAIPLLAEETSPPIEVGLMASNPGSSGSKAVSPVPAMKLGAVVGQYLKLGFTHIIPAGPDHILFVLGLFLLRPRLKTILWQITAFTIAHTVTLTLTALHVVGLPASFVEPAIAASVAFIAVENLFTREVRSWRIAVAFFFGLVHGMGVATVFNEAGFLQGRLVSSLAAFTVGVEAGHLAVLAAAFLLLGWWGDRPWFRTRVTIPGSLLIAAIAGFWFVQRIW